MTVSQSPDVGFEESQELEMIRETAREIASDYDDEYFLEVSQGTEPTEF